MAFRIVRNDIVNMKTEAIVNTANDYPTVGTGCDYAVYQAAGYDELLAYRKEHIGHVPEGEVFITPGFHLYAKYIIHAVSPLKVKHMVERQKNQFGWEFIFLGANIDAIEVAGRFGIDAKRAFNYECDREGTQLNYTVLSETVSRVRKAKSRVEADEAIEMCCASITQDFERRHKK